MTSTGSSKKLQKLEDDFNGGDPIDLTPYQNVLAMAGSMGFNTEDALEAAIITGTKDNLQLITDYIFLGPDDKKKRYDKKKAESTKDIKLSPEQEKAIEELKKFHREIQQEQFKINQLEQELTERQAVTKLEKCVEYLRGIIADEVITDAETEALEKYKQDNNIDEQTYEEALSKLDLTLMDVTDLQKKQDDTGGKMCILCKANAKEWCIFPCMHVVLCEGCAQDLKSASGPGSGTCPVCNDPFQDVQRVYID
mmetsp:Transcript_42154/g.37376  ORF Transcript_42154/g.37376 Transcript_42154/m.37376 type:complete len:253 (+) Transcript_42154:30-788(+)|eukprot:CAMPEP_0201572864 /NCGR_PEP_ID=MMETSP0190_2-20130828/16376_1 /ASSEMBLY_ACC=CAM_ASM_000263 /TAXON_ID=37353 /ORGANISM="Rosalina sp." /LENGTH=252 /DNA_ID=CAMNT_0047999153 /DNA_START=81 /DNA_END=839 /DNA_ORIENTATION=-